MTDLAMLALVVVAFLFGFPLVLRVLIAVLRPLMQALASTASVVARATRGTMARAGSLMMDNKNTVGEAVTFGAGSVYHMAEGAAIAWTELLLANATVAPLIGVTFSGTNMHYDLLLGVSTVFTALVYAETGANLVGWLSTMPFASVRQGRILAFLVAGAGFCGTIALLVALAYYRSQMIAEDVDPATVSAWVTVLPSAILVAMALLFAVAVVLAFTSIGTFFLTIAGVTCVLVGMVLGVTTFLTRLLLLGLELIFKMVETVAAWWGERSVLADAVCTVFKSLCDHLKELVAVKPKQQAEVIVPRNAENTAAVNSFESAAEQGDVILVQPRVTDVDPEDRQLVGLAARSTSGVDKSTNRWNEYPG